MKRILFSIAATVTGLVALLDFKTQGHPLAAPGGLPSAVASPKAGAAAPAPSSSTGSTGSTGSTRPTKSPARPATRAVKYTGSPIETRYGVVQVAVIATGNHIDNVSFVRLDAFDFHSQEINSQAAPILLQETLSAQSAHIDTVSGATYTSDGYIQSLQSALDQAGIK